MEMLSNGHVENNLTAEYTSVAKKKSKQRTMLSKRLVVCLVLVLVLVLVALVVIAVTLQPRPGGTGGSVATNGLLCHLNETVVLETSSELHSPCSTAVRIVESCQRSEAPAWRSFTPQSPDWASALKLVNGNTSFSTIVVSPHFVPRPGACNFHFTFDITTQGDIHTFLSTSSGIRPLSAHSATSGCLIETVPNNATVRFVVASTSTVITENASATVTSHACGTFEHLRQFGDVVPVPDKRLLRGARSECTLEIVNRTAMQCDWLRLRDVNTDVFDHVDTHACVQSGLRQQETHTWFLALSSNGKASRSRGLLVSPIIEGGASHVLFSFWYMIKCSGPLIRVFLVPHDASGPNVAPHEGLMVAQISNPAQTNGWQYQSYKLPVPADYKWFRVVLEGIVPSNGSCANHLCYMLSGNLQTPEYPLLVLDNLVVELLNEQCSLQNTNLPANIDCKFETSQNESTFCNWTPHCAIPFCDKFGMQPWKPHTGPFFNASGIRLHFAATDKSITHFRSPLVVANSNCSCDLSFSYYIQGPLIPRLEINLVLGADLNDKQRPLVRQWWFHGLQANRWVVSEIALNLNTLHPFQVELRAGYPIEITPGSGIYLDDFEFKNCDISHH